MTDEIISLASRRDKDADRYRDVDCQILDLARLIDLAVVTHFRESIEEQPISEYGTTVDFVLREMQRRLHEMVARLWDRPGGDGSAA